MPIYMDILNFIFTNDTSGGLKILLMIHVTLTTLGAIGNFAPIPYLFYNLITIVALSWSIYDRKNMEPLRLVMAFELCAIIIDVFYFGSQIVELTHLIELNFKGPFSAIMMVVHCVSRPFIIYYLIRRKDTQESLSIAGDYEPENYETVSRCSIQNNPFENHYMEIPTKEI